MTPEPRGLRIPPPTFPPAPPGTGTGPSQPFGRGDGSASWLYQTLIEGLNDLAVIRTSVETGQVFAVDLELQEDLAFIVQTASQRLAARLRLAAQSEHVQGILPWSAEARQRLEVLRACLAAGSAGAAPETWAAQVLGDYANLLLMLIREGADHGLPEP